MARQTPRNIVWFTSKANHVTIISIANINLLFILYTDVPSSGSDCTWNIIVLKKWQSLQKKGFSGLEWKRTSDTLSVTPVPVLKRKSQILQKLFH